MPEWCVTYSAFFSLILDVDQSKRVNRSRARIFKLLKTQCIVSKESIPCGGRAPLLVNTFPTHKQYGICQQGMKSRFLH